MKTKHIDIQNLKCVEHYRVFYFTNDTGSYEGFPLLWGDTFEFKGELFRVQGIEHLSRYLNAGATPYTVEVKAVKEG